MKALILIAALLAQVPSVATPADGGTPPNSSQPSPSTTAQPQASTRPETPSQASPAQGGVAGAQATAPAPPEPTAASCMVVACESTPTKGNIARGAKCSGHDVPKMLTLDFGDVSAPAIACLCCPHVTTPPRVNKKDSP